LRTQFDPVEEAMKAIGVVVWSMNRWEADDALATGAERWWSSAEQVRILTPDKDLGQCLRGTRVVQVDRMRKREIDEASLLATRGIEPASVPDYLALVGDDADGIPGVPGFGKKTAAALLRQYRRIEDIPRAAIDWKTTVRGAEALAATLGDHREAALLYRRLATLVRDVPLPHSLDELRWRGVPDADFEQWCRSVRAPEGLRTLGLSYTAERYPPTALQ
jgi:5'-3' exonuclease